MAGERLFHIGVKAIIRNADGEVLVLEAHRKDGTPYWDLPGGRMNPGEVPEDTLRRELQEEVGLTDVTVVRQLGTHFSDISITLPDGGTAGLVFFVYECAPLGEVALELEEGLAASWVPLAQAIERLGSKFPSLNSLV